MPISAQRNVTQSHIHYRPLLQRKEFLPARLRSGTVPTLLTKQLARGDTVSNFTPARADIDLMAYMRDHSSSLDRDNLLLQWLARESDALKNLQHATEEYGRAVGVVLAMQLIREYSLPAAPRKVNR